MENQVVQKKGHRAKYEYLIIIIIIAAVAAVAVGIYAAQNKAAKGEILMSELEAMRLAVMTYKTLNKTNPPDLATLTKATYVFTPGENPRPFLTEVQTNAEGKIVDPFGNPYKYNRKEGWVKSTTSGYEHW